MAQATAAGPVAPRPVVSGNRLLDATTGQPLRVAGVNRSGSEYACIQGWGIFDGPVDDTSLDAIASWHTNAVRVPLNEDCWLGINGVSGAYGGTAYRDAITRLVSRLHAHGLAAVLDLHWAAPGATRATSQQVAPDADHAVDFWRRVAGRFRRDPSVMFELFNEPRDISWSCWRNGCTTAAGWKATGAQQLVGAVRNAGARQPIIVDGLNWGGDLSGWGAHAPSDPQHQLVAGWHIYSFSGCSTATCWNQTAAPLARTYPVLLTEVGEDDCGTGFLDTILPWADSHHVGYLAWSWNTASCGGGPALISDYSGSPTAFGAGYRRHLAALAGSGGAGQPQPAPAPLDPAALFDFEDGTTQGWATRWGALGVAPEQGVAFSGSHGLALAVPGAGYPAAGVDTNLARVTPGSTVTYRLWAPPDVGISVSPMVLDQDWQASVLAARPVVPGWNTVRFTVPTGLGGVRVLGLQVDDASGWSGTVDVDDVTVTP